MPMKETEVGCFIRLFKRVLGELNLQNADGTGFDVNISPAYPFVTPNGVPESSGYQMPGNENINITPPEITIHTLRRVLPNNRYANNFIGNIYGEPDTEEEGRVIGSVYSQEVDITLQLTIWAEDPRQREFLKMQIERPYINKNKMRKLLFEIGYLHGWDDGFVVQNLYMTQRGDVDIQGNISQGDTIPRLYVATYEITFTTEIRDIDYYYKNTLFDVKDLFEAGLDPENYNIDDKESVKKLVIDFMKTYSIIISPFEDNGIVKSLSQVVREASIAYGRKKDIYVDVFNFMENFHKIVIGPIEKAQSNTIDKNNNLAEREE